MQDCIFCRIANGELATDYLYESESVVAFGDISPKAKTHLLIVPRGHFDTVNSFSAEDAGVIAELILAAKYLAGELGLAGYQLKFNVGEAGGQEVFHVHLHLLSNC